jgi:hypothetical protein
MDLYLRIIEQPLGDRKEVCLSRRLEMQLLATILFMFGYGASKRAVAFCDRLSALTAGNDAISLTVGTSAIAPSGISPNIASDFRKGGRYGCA